MLNLLKELAPDLKLRPGAHEALIEQAQVELVYSLPPDYTEFLRITDGAAGILASGDYIDLPRVEELAELNAGYGFPANLPGFVAFGTNDGGEAFVFRKSDGVIASIPLIGMSTDDVLLIGSDFHQFLRRARPLHWK